MRLISYQTSNGPRVAGVRADGYVDLQQTDDSLPSGMKSLLAMGPHGLQRAAAALERGKALDKNGVRLLAPVPDPQKVICIGLNYADHARETKKEPPAEPVVFCKFPTAVRAPGETIELPAVSPEVDYEGELVAVIGRMAKHVSPAQALEHVVGYCCGQDVSARDWQQRKPGGQWLLGKSFDTFAPFGPELVTADEVGNAGKLHIQLRLNGDTMQDSNTDQLIFSIAQLVAYVSQVCTLLPGDVLFTGTPAGVGAARRPQVFLKPGDRLEVEIEKLGTLVNPVVAAK
ncbi:MAG TPA: fumarylacetoacetate hydrolase family protein [Pirellulales bacterium]|jgi:2-keto-4-pentenoate hydratase/2-oxohepta-3-ene-1,7-dioic acid hydratase in catechol pathway|nr:fumarylacetoacetate hydrolase family protein [Pirellulales bacterium]